MNVCVWHTVRCIYVRRSVYFEARCRDYFVTICCFAPFHENHALFRIQYIDATEMSRGIRILVNFARRVFVLFGMLPGQSMKA
jgi:hypothetical protein